MKLTNAVEEIKRIAKRCDYAGDLSASALNECAEVYLANCDENGMPKPRSYMRSGEHRKPTHLSEFLWILVRTPSFRKWFGKSVVVDENGDPKVMYHGSWNAFKEFKTSAIKMSKVEMTLWSGPGFYFTDQEKIAKIYAGGKNDTVYSEFLRLENPLIVDETGNAVNGSGISKGEAEKIFLDGDNTQWLDSGICNELVRMDTEEGVKGRGKQYYKGLSRRERVSQYVSRLKTDVVTLKTASKAYGAKSQAKLLASICRHTKHDGVIHTLTPDIKEWVVYDPKSIKSATANSGEFSPDKAKVEDSIDFTRNKANATKIEKGSSDMIFKNLIDSLTKIVGNPADVHESGMDIVDRNGRHHQPKAIPEGGQFEEEGQYLSGHEKVEAALRHAGTGKRATLLREYVAPLYAKLGVDSAKRARIQAMHEDIRGMDKKTHLKAMARHMKDMKRHADAYNEVKDMSKEEFKNWLNEHHEYRNEINTALLNENRYDKHYGVKGGYHDDGTGKQKHEAWEEAKWGVGAKAMASMILFQEHADALSGAPDAIMANMIDRAGREEPQVENHEEMTPQVEQIETPSQQGETSEAQPQIEQPQVTGNAETTEQGSGEELTDANFEDAARKFAEHNHMQYNEAHARELRNFLDAAQRGELDMTAANEVGLRSNDMRFYNDIKNALGEDHPVSRALTAAVMAQRNHMPDDEIATTNTQAEGNAEVALAGNGEQNAEETHNDVVASNAPNYTDREGNMHPIEHNEGGLKGAIHASELAAVEAEKRQAFEDAENGVAGAEEYAHALSRFLGRGQDNRSPHPGMRQEGLLKHQLADKMQDRLDSKKAAIDVAQNALTEATNSGDENAIAQANEQLQNKMTDYAATQKAVKKIAEICGITPDALPDGTNFNHVRSALGAPIRAENPDNQEAINALHALANPEPIAEPEPTAEMPTNEGSSSSGNPVVAQTQGNATENEETNRASPQANEHVDNDAPTGNENPEVNESTTNANNSVMTDEEINSAIPRLQTGGIGGWSPDAIRNAVGGRNYVDTLGNTISPLELAERLRNRAHGVENQEDRDLLNRVANTIEEHNRENPQSAENTTSTESGNRPPQRDVFQPTTEESIREAWTSEFPNMPRAVILPGRRDSFSLMLENDNAFGNIDDRVENLVPGFVGNISPDRHTIAFVPRSIVEARRAAIATTNSETNGQNLPTENGNVSTSGEGNGESPQFTDEQLNEFVTQILNSDEGRQHPGAESRRSEFVDALRGVMNGIRPPSEAFTRQMERTLGVTHPFAQMTRNLYNSNNRSLNRTVGENGQVTYDLHTGDWRTNFIQARNLRGQNYEWPFRRNQQISVDALTPNLIRSVVFNLPFGVRSTWRIGTMGESAMAILENPLANMNSNIHNQMLSRIENSSNKHAKRFMQILNAMHPDFAQQRQRVAQERQERERQAARNALSARTATIIERLGGDLNSIQELANDDPNRVNFTHEDANSAINTIMNNLGDRGNEYREQVQQWMNRYQQTGNIPTSARREISNMLPSNHPLVVAIRDADMRQASERERKQIRAQHFEPTVDAAVKSRNKQMAEANNVEYSDSPIFARPEREYGYNCYLAALVYSLRRAGIKIPKIFQRPTGYGSDSQKYFIPTKIAMHNAGWKPVQGATYAETVANLNRLAQTKPNGYTIECWSDGHHGTHAFLLDGEWVWSDVFNNIMNRVVDSEQLARHIGSVSRNGDMPNEHQKRLMRVAILKGLTIEQRRQMTPEQKNQYVDEKIREGNYIVNSSYGHSPEQGFTEELIKEAMRTVS